MTMELMDEGRDLDRDREEIERYILDTSRMESRAVDGRRHHVS